MADSRPSTPPPPDLTGSKIGEYDIICRIGIGGMGVVYEGRHPVIGKRVAVKVLLPQLSADQELVDRFISEARAVNAIGHRGIVDIFSFGKLATGEHYFVMEFLNGVPFDRLIKHRAPMNPWESLLWIEEVCEALTAAHDAGIIHRDIKPSNLYLVDTGRGRTYVKLLDFGIAKLGGLMKDDGAASPQTRASVVLGTPDYMSPEQARGTTISPATDVYALGVVLYEMLTGRRPFKGENPLQTMFMHVENPAPRASDRRPELPQVIDDVLLWTMEKNPTARPETAEVLRAELFAIRNTLPEPPPGPRMSPVGSPRPSPSGTFPRVPTPMGAQGTPLGGTNAIPTQVTPSGQQLQMTPSGRQIPVRSVKSPSGRELVIPRSTPASGRQAVSGTPKTPSGKQGLAVPPRTPSGQQPRMTPSGRFPRATASRLPALGAPEQPPPGSEPTGAAFDGQVDATAEPLRPDLPDHQLAPNEPTSVGPHPEPALLKQAPEPERSPPVRSKGLVVGVVIGVAALLIVGVIAVTHKSEAVTITEVTPPEVVKPLEPVDPTPPEVKPPDEKPPEVKPPEVKPPEVKPPEVKPPEVKPPEVVKKGPALTDAAIAARISKLEKQLAAREAATGDTDRVLRQFLTKARADARAATTEPRRRELWKFLDEMQQQLGH